MKVLPECYVCALRQVLAAARLAGGDDFAIACLKKASEILAQLPDGLTPPEMGEPIYRIVREISGIRDPFSLQKKRQNEVVLALYPWLEERVKDSDDPLLTAMKLAIAGNAVDTGAQESFNLMKSISDALEKEGRYEAYELFRSKLEDSKAILYVADNCGEIVFDKLFIETIIRRLGAVEIILAVRGGPIINDVTEAEAKDVGLGELCEIIPTGMWMPGTLLEKTTEAFKRHFERADLVISKGQGNWETLEETDREIFFLLQAKCPVVARINKCDEGNFLLLHKP